MDEEENIVVAQLDLRGTHCGWLVVWRTASLVRGGFEGRQHGPASIYLEYTRVVREEAVSVIGRARSSAEEAVSQGVRCTDVAEETMEPWDWTQAAK